MPLSSKRILIVDDDEPIREMLSSILEIEGHQALVAQDGAEAVKMLRTGVTPDIILLDIMMPNKNGWQVLEELKSWPTTSAIPVVIISAYRETARTTPANAFVSKPIQLSALLGAIEQCCA